MTGALDPATEARVRASFAAQGMMATLSARLEALVPGRAVIAAPIRAQVGQQHGYAHAALAFALGDSAAGYAALSLMPAGAEVLTVEMKINLLAPAAGERLIATGEVIRAGRRLSVVKATVEAEAAGARKVVAVLMGTMIRA